MRPCPECRADLGAREDECPHCGAVLARAPTSNRIALRWAAIGVAVVLVWVGRYAINTIAARRTAALADAVAHVTLVASADTCPDATNPIGLVVQNNSSRTVKEIVFALEVTRPDAPENLALDSSNLRWTKVVQPGKQVTICRAWPGLASEFSGQFAVNARIHYVAFYEAGEVVPVE